MDLLFSSLVCHRDVKVWAFNWFCSRIHLDRGFDIPHMLLNDGSLTPEDMKFLNSLPNVWVDSQPIYLHDVPKPQLLGKLECIERGFQKHNAKRVVVMDCDIFFWENWDSELRKVCSSEAIAMRDWGSSLGPNVSQYRHLFGVHEDQVTPNCNTGIFSTTQDQWHHVESALQKHLNSPFMIMEDQGIWFAAFYGRLQYINNIKCVINGAETVPDLWNWILSQKGAHLQGMRVRKHGFDSLVKHCLEHLPQSIHLKQISPQRKHISYGLMEYDTYSFAAPWQMLPSASQGRYLTDALYMHGGSWALWKFDKRFTKFTTKVLGLDSGVMQNIKPVVINGQEFPLWSEVEVLLDGELRIGTQHGSGTHIAFEHPTLHLSNDWPDVGPLFEVET